MHSKNITHQDVKTENMLLGLNNTIKIADLGLSTKIPPGKSRKSDVSLLPYKSPEVVRCQEYDSTRDNWALGVTLFELLTGKVPFWGVHAATVIRAIENRRINWPDDKTQIPK